MGNKEAKGGRVTLKINRRHADSSQSQFTLLRCVASQSELHIGPLLRTSEFNASMADKAVMHGLYNTILGFTVLMMIYIEWENHY